jgi:hypothetical protein
MSIDNIARIARGLRVDPWSCSGTSDFSGIIRVRGCACWRCLMKAAAVLAPHFYRCARRKLSADLGHAGGKVFLNASMASGSCL